MESLEPLIKQHPFFVGLETNDAHFIVGCASNEVFEAGDEIFREGEPADRFYLIREGKVALENLAPDQPSFVFQTLAAGEVLGWSWLVPPYRWCFNARAVEVTRAITLNAECLRTKCDEEPRLGYELLKRFASAMTKRLQATRMQLLDVYGTQQ
jgi:CRP-like cAMP-binding protein